LDFSLANIFGPHGALLRARLYAPSGFVVGDAAVGDLPLVEIVAEIFSGSVTLSTEPAASRSVSDGYEYEVRQVEAQTADAFDASTTQIIDRGLYGYVVDGAWSAIAPVSATAYLSPAAVVSLAATLPGLSALTLAPTGTVAPLVEQATLDVDTAGPYQGRKYDPAQAHEFPRVPYPASGDPLRYGATSAPGGAFGEVVWDWDAATNAAVVPLNVQKAVAYQAAYILSGAGQEAADRQAAIAGGLASQSVGGMSESYQAAGSGGVSGRSLLAPRALQLLRPYFLKTGKLL
jgi:hypothetical protein